MAAVCLSTIGLMDIGSLLGPCYDAVGTHPTGILSCYLSNGLRYKLGGHAHEIVTKIVHKTLPGGLGPGRGGVGVPSFSRRCTGSGADAGFF